MGCGTRSIRECDDPGHQWSGDQIMKFVNRVDPPGCESLPWKLVATFTLPASCLAETSSVSTNAPFTNTGSGASLTALETVLQPDSTPRCYSNRPTACIAGCLARLSEK